MAYQSFYRTYRPKCFDEAVGQKTIIKTLKNALANNKIGHAYLFCGPRGTGKTTFARIFAKALNCEEGIGHECDHCENCLAVNSGSHPDIYELDAASNSGVDNIRDLIEQIRYQPILGRYKIYIIDEVHSMTSNAFNALLKTLEEPPAHVIFILATTEPQKVLPTILSRVQRFDFSKISEDDLVTIMKRALDEEKITYETKALRLIARLADGGARDALSILEQVASYGGDKVSEEDVQTLFGLVSIKEKINLVKLIHDLNISEVIKTIHNQYLKGADLVRLHDDLISIYKDLLVYGTTRDESLLTVLNVEEALPLGIGPTELRRNIDSLAESRRYYRSVNNSYDHFELSVLKILEPVEKQVAKPVVNEQPSSKPVEVEKPKPVVSPITETNPEPIKPAPVQNTSSISATKPLVEAIASTKIDQNDELLHFDDEELINIMLQGNKSMKEDLIKSWNALQSLTSDPELGSAAAFLANTAPRIVNLQICVVVAPLVTQIKRINSIKSREVYRKVMNKAFGLPIVVYALTSEELIRAVSMFRQLAQIHKLPEPKPIEKI